MENTSKLAREVWVSEKSKFICQFVYVLKNDQDLHEVYITTRNTLSKKSREAKRVSSENKRKQAKG